MKKQTYKPILIIDGYQMKKHYDGGFKIIEYSHYSNENFQRKRTVGKHLTLTDAEDMLYRMERKLTK